MLGFGLVQMLASIRKLNSRPRIVTLACAVLALWAGYVLFGALSYSSRHGTSDPMVHIVSLADAVNFILLWLIWSGRGWSRYLLLFWYIVPTLFLVYTEAPILEVAPSTLLMERTIFSWLAWWFLLPLVALFHPTCANRYRNTEL